MNALTVAIEVVAKMREQGISDVHSLMLFANKLIEHFGLTKDEALEIMEQAVKA